jgi:hypothetical protein
MEMQPKCAEKRDGHCNEAREAWESCPLGKLRPYESLEERVLERRLRAARAARAFLKDSK